MKSKNFSIMLIASVTVLLGFMAVPSNVFAENYLVDIDKNYSIEKTEISMNIPEDNKLPFAYITGFSSTDNPVIIQFYKDNEPVHFAQVDVNDDGSYEYQFRISNVNSNGETVKAFDGDYIVKIFKTIYDTGSI